MTNEESAILRLKMMIDQFDDMRCGHNCASIHMDILDQQSLYTAIEVLKEKDHPRRSWGKWVISEVRCPECLEYFDTDCDKGTLNTCPNCGMDMKRT